MIGNDLRPLPDGRGSNLLSRGATKTTLEWNLRMWCEKCQTDVGTEVAPDNRRVLCAICGHALGETATSQLDQPRRPSRTTEARELLDRWANSRPLDPFGPPKKRVTEDNLTATSAPANPLPTVTPPMTVEPTPVVTTTDRRDEFGLSSIAAD